MKTMELLSTWDTRDVAHGQIARRLVKYGGRTVYQLMFIVVLPDGTQTEYKFVGSLVERFYEPEEKFTL